jgi:hypothetical protein
VAQGNCLKIPNWNSFHKTPLLPKRGGDSFIAVRGDETGVVPGFEPDFDRPPQSDAVKPSAFAKATA